jgi:4-amino-4-deoxy-L-arabinose transferase-like glycosyltransferase
MIPVLLILLGILLRLYQFGGVPVSLNRDEAALGYNAFAIQKSGIDEWGNRLPLMFKSFGDYKLPVYIYFLSPLLTLFSVHDAVIRLPSMLAGLWIVFVSYRLVLLLTKNNYQALMAAAMISLQPWAIFYSRMAYEANVGLALFLTSLWCGLRYLNGSNRSLVFVALLYLVSLFTYNSPLLLAPVIIVFLLVNQRYLLRRRLTLAATVLVIAGIGGLILLPVSLQKKGITIFSDPTVISNQMKGYSQSTNVFNRLWWNRSIYPMRLMAENVFNSFKPDFLVTTGGANPWHSTPGKSHLLAITYGLGIVSMAAAIKRLRYASLPWIVLFLGSLLPAMITVDAPHATRSLFFLWLFSVSATVLITKNGFLRIIVPIVIVIEIFWWSYLYFVSFPGSMHGNAWPVGLKASLQHVKHEYEAGKSVRITDARNQVITEDQLYIYPLLYFQVDPATYIETANISPPDVAGMIRVNSFDRVSLVEDNQRQNAIIIERNEDGIFKVK